MVDARRQGRRWGFGQAMLDEDSWTLSVDGCRVSVEAKPLELLHELLLHAGSVVTKAHLLDAVWPNVSVVEASLPTAIAKLRRALGDAGREQPIIETAPRVGYRLAIPITINDPLPVAPPGVDAPQADRAPIEPTKVKRAHWVLIAGGLAVALAAGTLTVANIFVPLAAPTQREAATALRKLDVEGVERMLAAGWNPNTPFNKEGDAALSMLLNVCEWDRGHDRKRLLLVARTLLEGGAGLDTRNSFGDTPYSIASARRFCGPDHPVTLMFKTLCAAGWPADGEHCLAKYATIAL